VKTAAVVVSHDSARVLPRCLESLAEAAAGRLEVVVVDGGSKDGSPDLVRAQFPFARVLELGGNRGFGAADNRGATEVASDALLLLNPDAWLVGDALDRLTDALDGDLRLGLVAPRLRYPDGRPQFVWAPDRGVVGEALQKARNRFEARGWSHRPLERLLRLLDPGWLTVACALVRRAAFDQVGGFDPGYFLYFEDVDLGLRLRRAGWRAAVVEGATACHLGGGGGALSEVTMLHYRQSQLRYYRQHRPAWEARVLLWRLRRRYREGPVAEWLAQL
jgi:GT2 family glycosyltransferase